MRPSSVRERLVGIVRPVVVGAQVGVRRGERAFALVVQGGRLLVHRHGAGIVAERLEREPHRVDGFEVGRIQRSAWSNALRACSHWSWIENSVPRL